MASSPCRPPPVSGSNSTTRRSGGSRSPEPRSRRHRHAQLVEAAIEILDQILGILESDVEAQRRSFRSPTRRGAAAFGAGRQDQAFKAAPAGADTEQVERVDHRIDGRLGCRLEDDAEQPARAEKVAFPQ